MAQTMETGTRLLLGRCEGGRLSSDAWPSLSSGPGLMPAETVRPTCCTRACSLLTALAAAARRGRLPLRRKNPRFAGVL